MSKLKPHLLSECLDLEDMINLLVTWNPGTDNMSPELKSKIRVVGLEFRAQLLDLRKQEIKENRAKYPWLSPGEEIQAKVDKIQAIKDYRSRVGCSVSEAKAKVDEFLHSIGSKGWTHD